MGALAVEFISVKLAKKHSLLMVVLAYLYKLKLTDDNLTPIVTYYVQFHFWLRNYYNELKFFVTTLRKFNLILEKPWLE